MLEVSPTRLSQSVKQQGVLPLILLSFVQIWFSGIFSLDVSFLREDWKKIFF